SLSGPDGWQTRLYYSKAAGNTFVDQMDPTQDKVGLVTYHKSASVIQTLTTNLAAVRSGLNAMVSGSSTNERMGTYLGINDMVSHAPDTSRTVNAIIVTTDG